MSGDGPGAPDPGPKPAPPGPARPDADNRPQRGSEDGEKPAPGDGFLVDTGGATTGKEGRTATGGAAARIARESRAALSLHDASTYIGGEIGSVNFQFGGRAQRMLAGPLPDEELGRLRDRFTKPPSYDDFRRQLAREPLLVLSGQPGTGRMFTALSLLDDLARGKVSRLDPGSDLTTLGDDGSIAEKHGYALEPADARLPAELHLDRLRRLLAERGSFAVLLTVPDPGDPGSRQTRYHRTHEPAAAETVLDGHLTAELEVRQGTEPGTAPSTEAGTAPATEPGTEAGTAPATEPGEQPARADAASGRPPTRPGSGTGSRTGSGDRFAPAKTAAVRLAARSDVRAALGLESLLPAEAARFATLLARCVTGEITEEQLIAECRRFAVGQVQQWFAGGTEAETLPALRDAAYRIALAVFGHGSFNTVAEAAELLAWELAVTVDPERVIGRPLLSDGLEARLASARATTEIRPQPVVAGQDIPVRTVRFRGEGLAPALLAHLWEHHHNMRGPVLRWLDSLCQDPREDVWTRAAVASGELCRHDCAHTLSDLLIPMAEAEQARRGLFVATALDSVLRDPKVGEALRALVEKWGGSADANLMWTAAAVLSRGTATATIAEALGRLGRIGTWEEGRLRVIAAESVVHLTASTSAAEPLTRIRGWLSDNRRHHQDLGLVATVLLCEFQTEDVWNPAPELTGREKWPLALAIAAARPDRAAEVAGLLWTALNTSRSYESALSAVSGWLRGCRGRPWEEALARFLPLLVLRADDQQRLLSLIKELSGDPDDPLGQEQSRRLRQAVQEVGNR